MKNFILMALLFAGVQSYATTDAHIQTVMRFVAPQNVSPLAVLQWKINDSCDYNLKGGFLSGSIRMFVREENEKGFWVQQDVDLGFMGKQKVETLYDKNNGQILEVRVEGEKKDLPSQDDMEIVESRRERVTVPKDTYDSIYMKLRNKKDNKETQLWVNPSQIPIGGLLKTISASEIGEISLELTNFQKN
jgi:hypothetical protein